MLEMERTRVDEYATEPHITHSHACTRMFYITRQLLVVHLGERLASEVNCSQLFAELLVHVLYATCEERDAANALARRVVRNVAGSFLSALATAIMSRVY